ncbi:protein phosphatase regulator [Madurella fahalii]|uniref:Protein phosphatase regulator n=1 Tax=Madurella fahalii TaxID=1157608 RepID=A0ABQ0G051_9PEZI
MAVVLGSEEDSYFSSTLRRSHSQPKFVTKRAGFHTSASASRLADLYREPSASIPYSPSSSAPSSPRAAQVESSDLSSSSTPATNFSLASDCDEAASRGSVTPDDIILPQYEDVGYFGRLEALEPPPSPQTGDSPAPSPNEQDDSAATSRPGSPEIPGRAEDDIALRAQPSRHVDYLSHNWREEDIWSSWKHIVSRRGDYSNAARLENASWRTWMKAKNKLSTVSPETLNWLKDCDVTWLYGPLQTGSSSLNKTSTTSNSSRLSKSNSFIHKKPILKKRSMSEIMLQRSLSTSSLVKQAAAAVQAQQKEGLKRIGRRPVLERATTDYITFPFSSRGLSHDGTSLFPSTRSSGIISPSGERKHIHFNEQVSQCIAVEVKGDDDDEDDGRYPYDSDSDDGAIMMKRTQYKKRRPTLRRAKTPNNTGESKTIAMLPSTTLKYREDTPEPTESAMKHSTGVFRSPVISPSSSQETLRPSKKSGKLFIAGDDEDGDDDEEDGGIGGGDSGPSISSALHYGEGSSGLRRSVSSSSLSAEPAGMRRTESGMFMPFEEGSASSSGDGGLIGRVIDTVNTARDIAHVIWNVGWRK